MYNFLFMARSNASWAAKNAARGMARSALCALMACLMAVSSGLSTTALAQSADTEVDLQPPVINFEAVEIGNAGEVQVFTADITEERALKSAIFYHRFNGDESYIRTNMRQLSGTTLYSVSISTDSTDVRDIEYYIQAEDTGGNRAIKGFVFDPLVRRIQVPESSTPVVAEQSAVSGMSTNRKILWGVLGLLAVGLIAGAVGGGGGGGGGGEPVGPTTPVNVIFNPDAN